MEKKTIKMSGSEIYAWVQREENSFARARMESGNLYFDRHRNKVRITNVRTGRTATAKCANTDDFNIAVGVAIAWARYCNRPIPEGM